MLLVKLGTTRADGGAVFILVAYPADDRVEECTGVLKEFKRLALLLGAGTLLRVPLVSCEGLVSGQVCALTAVYLGEGGPWATQGPFQLNQEPGELSPRKLRGAEVGS